MPDPSKRLEEMIAKLKQLGHRLTPQRIAILRVLAHSTDHPSIEMIFSRVKPDFPSTSLATIYKTVTLLKELEEVLELPFGHDSSRYNGIRPYPHPHLVCVKCKTVSDAGVESLHEFAEEVSQRTGYHILRQRVDFYGICPDCQKKI